MMQGAKENWFSIALVVSDSSEEFYPNDLQNLAVINYSFLMNL
jgi:hypothetical protein